MDLNYYLDLIHLCDVNEQQFDSFFTFAFKVEEISQRSAYDIIKEHFFKDDDALLQYMHKSGKPLTQLIFERTGEVANRIIPAVLSYYHAAKNTSKIKFGKISNNMVEIHPNAKLTTLKTGNQWELSEIDHYNTFRKYHIEQKVLSTDCEEFIHIYLPNIELTKKALTQYKKIHKNNKEGIISDLNKLNDFIDTKWKNGDFSIDLFSKKTGVDASDESDTTKKDPKCKDLRKFSIPNIGSVYCFLHIKISKTYRIYFYPDRETKKVYITYIGKHLKTAKF